MLEISQQVQKFLPHLRIETKPFTPKGLSLIFKELYSFKTIYIQKNELILVEGKHLPAQYKSVKKHDKILSEKIKKVLLWVLPHITFYQVQALMKEGINFLVPKQNLHLPFLFTSLKKHKREPKLTYNQKLSPIAINVLIYQILKQNLNGLSQKEVANKLNLNPMTLLRAFRTIEQNKLLTQKKDGRELKVTFESKEVLWKSLKEKGPNPIQEVLFLNASPKNLPFSGEYALSKLGMLAQNSIANFAIHRKQQKDIEASEIEETLAKSKIELWNRSPILTKNKCINPIDLYLCLRKEKDERIQIELETLLEKNNLSI